jgi:RimJ/RimL family protein N-acetyltransferase
MLEWTGTPILTTPRLVLRTFRREDLPAYAALNRDPEVVRYLGGPLSREDSDGIAEWAQECYARDGIGLLAVERRSDGEFLGMCGVHHQESVPDELEVGWRLAHAYWGQGYATEAATAWLDYAFDRLGRDQVISITDPPNLRSLAVMHRLGMVFQREAQVEDGGVLFDAVIHVSTAQQWADRAGRKCCGCSRSRSVPAEEAGGGDPADGRPDGQGHPVVQRYAGTGAEDRAQPTG